MLPDKLYFEITGHSRESHQIELRGDCLWHRQAEAPGARVISAKITPEPKQWQAFWRTVEAADVWHWQKAYSAEICDGTQWSLKMKLGDRQVRCAGSNAYPGSDAPRLFPVGAV